MIIEPMVCLGSIVESTHGRTKAQTLRLTPGRRHHRRRDLAGAPVAAHDAPPCASLPTPRPPLLRLHTLRRGTNPEPQPFSFPDPPPPMAASRRCCLLLGPATAAASSISASGSVAVGRRRSHCLVAEPRRGRQVRCHRRDLVRVRSPLLCLRRRTPVLLLNACMKFLAVMALTTAFVGDRYWHDNCIWILVSYATMKWLKQWSKRREQLLPLAGCWM